MAIDFKIVKSLGKLSDGSYEKEVNLVEWGSNRAKLDVRGWNEDHTKMTKGITLTRDEALILNNILYDYLKATEKDA